MSSQVTVLLTMSPVRLVRLRGHVSWLSTARTGTVIRITQAETMTSIIIIIQQRNDITELSPPQTESILASSGSVSGVFSTAEMTINDVD